MISFNLIEIIIEFIVSKNRNSLIHYVDVDVLRKENKTKKKQKLNK